MVNMRKEGDDDRYDALFQSIRSPTGLEIGVKVMWPNVMNKKTAAPSTHGTLYITSPEDEIAPMFHGTGGLGRGMAGFYRGVAIHGTTEQQRLIVR
jgi:hypothetical protein